MTRTRGFAISVDDQRFVTNTTSASVVSESAELFVAAPVIKTVVYPGDDTAANTAGGQTIKLTGNNFRTGVQVYVNGNAVPSVTYNSSSNVVFTTPALSAATYPIYLVNTDGSVAIFIPGLQISGEPTWVTGATLSEQEADVAWNISLSATSDSSVTYALAAGSSLPSGISLAANGLISGTMSSPPNEETTYNFTVVATDTENQDASRAFSVTVTIADEYFKDTVLLLHGDGSNNQNNHTFLDSSNNNFTITRNGNATQGSFSPFSQTGWSGYFDGSGDYLQISDNAAFEFGSGNFTIEGWINPNSLAAGLASIITKSDGTGSAYAPFLIGRNGSSIIVRMSSTGSSWDIANAVSFGTLQLNQWQHFALVRNGTSITGYLNGVGTSIATTSASLHDNANNLLIGAIFGSSITEFINAYLSNIRLVKGAAVYTSNFTPPTAPLTNIANTSLLTLQSNRFVDNSNNNFTITRNGDTRIVPYSPFAPTSNYTTANVGGSGYFDGTGDYLSVADNDALELTDNNFTIEAWINPSAFAQEVSSLFYKRADASFQFSPFGIGVKSNGKIALLLSKGSTWDINTEVGSGITVNQWSHIALVRNGSNIDFFINGTKYSVSTSFSGSLLQNSDALTIGVGGPSGGSFMYPYNGYISDFRILKGTALYTSNFTPPTAPLTNIANTSLLCNFTNAGIFDSTAKNVLETVGDAKVNTSVVKYGTGSIILSPGNGSHYAKMPLTEELKFGTGDFTIECWIYLITNAAGICAVWSNYSSFSAGSLALFAGHTTSNVNLFHIAHNGGFPALSSSTTVNSRLSTWTHLAVVRYNGQIKLYINGTSEGTPFASTVALNGVGTSFWIGTTGDSPASNPNCYIDDFRVTKGIARYTADFTPPTAAFKDK